MDPVLHLQAVAVVTAVLAAAGLYAGLFHLGRFEPGRIPKDTLFPESELELPWTSVVSLMRQTLTQRNFRLFPIMNSFQAFHLTFLSNFMMVFAEVLVPTQAVPSPLRSAMYGQAFSAHRNAMGLHASSSRDEGVNSYLAEEIKKLTMLGV